MIEVVLISFGVAVGAGVAWFWASANVRAFLGLRVVELEGRLREIEAIRDDLRHQLDRKDEEISDLRSTVAEEQKAKVESQTRMEAAQQSLKEQKDLLEKAQATFKDVFEALSARALKDNHQSFLDLAKESLKVVVNEATGDIGKRQEAIDGLIKPIRESLERYEDQVQGMENKREQAYGSLLGQIESLAVTQQELQRETGNLVTALRTPQVRGRWGELTLHRVVELAGMSEHCDYVEQESITVEPGRFRPDMIVHLPAQREIVVDAKVPLNAYLDALSASTEDERKIAKSRHAQQLRSHMNRLASKAYWEQFPKAPEFVVMFIPGESFFAAAVDCDRSLIEEGMAKRVIPATPTTLIAVLLAVAYGWRQERIAENAQAISDLGKQLYDRLRSLAEHLNDTGSCLGKALNAYNRAVGSLESRVFSSARRFKELGAATGEDISLIESIDQMPRKVTVSEVN
jgi:DNA recombination protein RmuC